MSCQSPLVTASCRRSFRLNRSSSESNLLDLETNENHSLLQSGDENSHKRNIGNARRPLTPVQNNLVYNLRHRLEQQLSESFERRNGDSFLDASTCHARISPGLNNLRLTPGPKLKEKQNLLLRKHDEARSKVKESCVGGGVSIWPQMDDMRLSMRDVWFLLISSLTLAVSVLSIFTILHGTLMTDLRSGLHRLKTFSASHLMETSDTQKAFESSVLTWHTSFTALLDELKAEVEVSLIQTSFWYQVYLLLYVCGILLLLYYLADNVLATNKLTPHRIKIWINLLVVMGTWTLLMLQLLVLAQAVEGAIESNVHLLNSQLGNLVYLPFDLTKFRNVLTYWTTRCLPPTTTGTLSIVGVVAVKDVSYYLQYYSLPVLTALLTPVVRLVMALGRIYSVKVHK